MQLLFAEERGRVQVNCPGAHSPLVRLAHLPQVKSVEEPSFAYSVSHEHELMLVRVEALPRAWLFSGHGVHPVAAYVPL